MSDHRLRDRARLHIGSGIVYRGPPTIIGVGMNAFDPDRIPLALTFYDVLLRPGRSAVLPAQASTRTRLTRGLELGIPLISDAIATVNEGSAPIAMAE